MGKHGLSLRICPLALGLVVKAALIFDAEFSALIGNEGIDFERSGFGTMPEPFGDLEGLLSSTPRMPTPPSLVGSERAIADAVSMSEAEWS